LWLKLLVAVFVCLFVAFQCKTYGPVNLLWFSNVGILGGALALWLENRLLAGMMLLSIFIADGMVWSLDFLLGLFGWHPFDAAIYMFDQSIPLHIRAVSLSHVVAPAFMAWMVYKLRYDKRAFPAQILLSGGVILLTYALTNPARNINWAFGIGSQRQTFGLGWLYTFLQITVVVPVVLYLPAHLLLLWLDWHLPKKETADSHKPT
jgi:hypothetical protein